MLFCSSGQFGQQQLSTAAAQLQLTTAFGAFLDPVADKIMVATALILLATDPPSSIGEGEMVLLVVIIICRELTMSALREWAACRGKGARKVSRCRWLHTHRLLLTINIIWHCESLA